MSSSLKQTRVSPQPGFLAVFVFALFFFSGAIVLIYEVAWTRILKLEFGATSLAISTVITVFMAGLALGAYLAGKRADRLHRPLFFYGIIEIFIALYALIGCFIFPWALTYFSKISVLFADSFWVLSLWRFVMTTLLLLPPTLLMGATLPILSRFLATRRSDAGRGVGLLYGVNTIGAFLGVVVAGFILLPHLGLNSTLILTAGCNLLLGLLACVVAKKTESKPGRATSLEVGPDAALPFDMIVVASALTGCAAMICEVAWSRVLTLVLGASVYSFTIVLSVFLAGLGLGACCVAYLLRVSALKARTVFFGFAICAAVSVAFSSATFSHLPSFFVKLFWDLNLKENSENIFWIQAVIAAIVMFGPALSMGALFSAAVQAIVRKKEQAGQSVGRLYAYNTLGAILGSFSAGFILIPCLGIRNTIILAATVQCFGAIASILSRNWRTTLAGTLVAAAVIPVLFLATPHWDKQLMTSGMFRNAKNFNETMPFDIRLQLAKEFEVLFYRDGLTATVTVSGSRNPFSDNLSIATNGKVDGSTAHDMPTQRLLAHLPLLFHPKPDEVCIVGLGTGCTAGSAALHPNVKVKVVEIEEAMVEGARLFRDHNYAVHENPKVDIKITDARLFLKLRHGTFDVIISEPSNPWLAGTSDLFTREFYRIGAKALRRGGIFCQWVPVYGMSLENLKLTVRTFLSVFPHTYLANTIPNSDILLLGSLQPITLDPEKVKRRMAFKAIQQDLADPRLNIRNIYDLLALVTMAAAAVKSFAGSGPIHTDDLPILAYRTPLELYLATNKSNMDQIYQYAQANSPFLEIAKRYPESERFFKSCLSPIKNLPQLTPASKL
ncbi:fused MFS/spermidine synthase [candidate division KSB1 bacterium]|nr:fused MFS/spermidine synthase [candidate division KSB1 bacterium]